MPTLAITVFGKDQELVRKIYNNLPKGYKLEYVNAISVEPTGTTWLLKIKKVKSL